MAWRFDLYGGTVLLAASREPGPRLTPDSSVTELLSDDARVGVRDPLSSGGCRVTPTPMPRGLRDWLVAQRTAGRSVLGYGAASRAVALVVRAGVDRQLLPAIVDSSPSKHGLRMPGTDIPIVGPASARHASSAPRAPVRTGSADRGPQGLSRGRRRRGPMGGCRDAPRMTSYQTSDPALVPIGRSYP